MLKLREQILSIWQWAKPRSASEVRLSTQCPGGNLVLRGPELLAVLTRTALCLPGQLVLHQPSLCPPERTPGGWEGDRGAGMRTVNNDTALVTAEGRITKKKKKVCLPNTRTRIVSGLHLTPNLFGPDEVSTLARVSKKNVDLPTFDQKKKSLAPHYRNFWLWQFLVKMYFEWRYLFTFLLCSLSTLSLWKRLCFCALPLVYTHSCMKEK